jgi:small subunit ribosomal protein S20
MPNTKSAKHRLRQSQERRVRNRAVKSSLRTAVRKLYEAVNAKQFDSAQALYRNVSKALDQSAAKGVIHGNKASRLKSRLSAMVKKATVAA